MFKAKYDVGGYKKGEIVPDEKVQLWNKMYLTSPVEYVDDVHTPVVQPKENLDLNNDGKIDKKDAKIASKVMNEVNKHPKRK